MCVVLCISQVVCVVSILTTFFPGMAYSWMPVAWSGRLRMKMFLAS